MDLITLLILILATWRLTSLLVNEPGPFDAFERIRAAAGIYLDEWSQPQADNVIGKALTCAWCTSVWVGIGVAVLWLSVPYTPLILLPFALSGGAIIVEAIAGNDQG